MSVTASGASPLAKDLFQHGFAMTLSFFDDRLTLPRLADAEKMGLEVQKTLGRRRSLICARCRRTRFLALQKDCRLGCAGTVAVSPVVDGYFLPDAVPAVFAAGRQNDVPTVVGFTRDESSNDLRTAVNLGAYIAAAHKHYAHRADELLDLYPAHDDAEATIMGNTAARGVVETDTRNWALSERATGNAPFYVYMISRVIPSWRTRSCSTIRRPSAPTTPPMSLLVRDTGCVEFFRTTRNWAPYDRELADKMSDCLVAFAKTGDPSTEALAWPAWSDGSEQYVEFGDAIAVRAENVDRMQFQNKAGVTSATPSASHD